MEDVPKPLPSEEIPAIAEKAYSELARHININSAEIYHLQHCENMSDELKIALDKRGIESRIVTYWGWKASDPKVVNHDFLIFIQNGEEWIADPTWQQFLTQPDPTLPHVLISKKSEIIMTLAKLKMPPSLHHIWLNAD